MPGISKQGRRCPRRPQNDPRRHPKMRRREPDSVPKRTRKPRTPVRRVALVDASGKAPGVRPLDGWRWAALMCPRLHKNGTRDALFATSSCRSRPRAFSPWRSLAREELGARRKKQNRLRKLSYYCNVDRGQERASVLCACFSPHSSASTVWCLCACLPVRWEPSSPCSFFVVILVQTWIGTGPLLTARRGAAC